MTTAPNDTTPAGLLATLRALAVQPSPSLPDLLHAADQQAELLRTLLPSSPEHTLKHLTHLIPSILVNYVNTLPVPGTAFWGNRTWHIHIRTSDPINVQAFTGLHELKHIIDHPLRHQCPAPLNNNDWEALADHFAARMLTQEIARTTTTNHNPTGRKHIPPPSTTETGGSP
jgi:hypothetical protein